MGTRVYIVTPWTLFRCLSRRKITIIIWPELLENSILFWSSIVWVHASFGVVYLAWGAHFFALYIACPGYIADSVWAIAINFLSKPKRTVGRIGFSPRVIRRAYYQYKKFGGYFSKGLLFSESVCFDAFRFYSWWSVIGDFGFVDRGKPSIALLDSYGGRPRHLNGNSSILVAQVARSVTWRLVTVLKHAKFLANPGKIVNFIIGLQARSCAITHNWITAQGRKISKLFDVSYSRKNTDSFL